VVEWLHSVHNERIKAWAALKERKYRERNQAYLVEGLRAVATYHASGAELQAVLFDPYGDRGEQREALATACEQKGVAIYAVPGEVLARVADTEQPQGMIAVARMPQFSLEDLLAGRVHAGQSTEREASLGASGATAANCADVVVLADGIRDPGNLGTLIRTADAVGARAVLTVTGTADLYQPKVVRASMGSLAHVPVWSGDVEEILTGLQRQGLRIVAADAGDGESVLTADLRGPLVLAIGSEAVGLSAAVLSAASARVNLPMPGRAESLNAGIAAAVMLYESLRQRGNR